MALPKKQPTNRVVLKTPGRGEYQGEMAAKVPSHGLTLQRRACGSSSPPMEGTRSTRPRALSSFHSIPVVSFFSVVMFNRKTRFILPIFGFEIAPGCNVGRLCCLDHTAWACPPAPLWLNLDLSNSILIRLLRASGEAQDSSHTSTSGHKGEEKTFLLPLSQSFSFAKQCSFQNEVASILPNTEDKS